jgi:hypothetical protein
MLHFSCYAALVHVWASGAAIPVHQSNRYILCSIEILYSEEYNVADVLMQLSLQRSSTHIFDPGE